MISRNFPTYSRHDFDEIVDGVDDPEPQPQPQAPAGAVEPVEAGLEGWQKWLVGIVGGSKYQFSINFCEFFFHKVNFYENFIEFNAIFGSLSLIHKR